MQGLVLAYWAVALAAIFTSALLAWQTWEHRRYVRSRVRHPSITPCKGRVALFVPCKGADPDLKANLRPLFEQDHGNYELIVVVESLADAACSVIDRLIGQYPHHKVKLVVAGITATHGQKVHNLLAATADLSPDIRILAFVDDDVRPPSYWLRMLTQRLNEYVASTGYRWFVPERSTFANCLLSSVNAAVIPIMFPGYHHKVWGGSWAIRREMFDAAGVREAWQNTLSDDLVAGNVLARLRRRISVEPACILPSPVDMSLGAVFSFVRRQYTIGRFYSPLLWTVMLLYSSAMQAVFWGTAVAAACGLAVGTAGAWKLLLVTMTLYGLHAFRGRLRQQASRPFMAPRWNELAAARRFDIWLAPLSSLAIWYALVRSAFGRVIAWKDIKYEMCRDGKIRRISRSPHSIGGTAVGSPVTDVRQRLAA